MTVNDESVRTCSRTNRTLPSSSVPNGVRPAFADPDHLTVADATDFSVRDRLLVADAKPTPGEGIDRKERRAGIHDFTDSASRASLPDADFGESPLACRVPHDALGFARGRPRLDADETRTP